MQIKGPEQTVRCFLVILTLLAVIYASFLIQVSFASWKFNNAIFEKIDCSAQHQGQNRSQIQTMAYSTWNDYYQSGPQAKLDVLAAHN